VSIACTTRYPRTDIYYFGPVARLSTHGSAARTPNRRHKAYYRFFDRVRNRSRTLGSFEPVELPKSVLAVVFRPGVRINIEPNDVARVLESAGLRTSRPERPSSREAAPRGCQCRVERRRIESSEPHSLFYPLISKSDVPNPLGSFRSSTFFARRPPFVARYPPPACSSFVPRHSSLSARRVGFIMREGNCRPWADPSRAAVLRDARG
jgi:hypothetical protein